MATTAVRTTLRIKSPAFKDNSMIPQEFTCEGKGSNPPLTIEDLPENTKSLALIIEDPDAPGKVFDHWVVWNIPPDTTIRENSKPGITGRNGKGENKYTGPCPPSGTHRYFFKVYALDTLLDLEEGASKQIVVDALQNHILAYGEIVGLYKKQILG